MPGPMAVAAAEACLRKGMDLSPACLTGPEIPEQDFVVTDPDTKRSQTVSLVPSNAADGLLDKIEKTDGKGLTIAVD